MPDLTPLTSAFPAGSWLAEPLFWLLPVGGSLLSMVAFATFAFPLTWLAARQPAWALAWRIQDRPAPVSRDLGRSVRQWLLNNLAMTTLAVAAWPLMALSGVHTGTLPPAWVVGAQLLFFVLLDDFLYYWMHRALHHPRIYRQVHAVHHRVVTPSAVTAHYMHPVEYVLTGGLMLLGPLALGSHVAVLYAWIVLRQWEAAEGHSGFSIPWSPTRWLPPFDGPDHHDFHHRRVKGNYAGYLPWVDRLMGTELPAFREHRARRGGRLP